MPLKTICFWEKLFHSKVFMSKMGSKSGKGKLDWRRLTWQGSTCRSLVYLRKIERNVFLLPVLSYTYAIDHRWVHGRKNWFKLQQNFSWNVYFWTLTLAKAGLMLLNKLQCHFFHEVKRKHNRRIRVILPVTEGRSGLVLDCGLSPQRNTSQLILDL